MLCYHISYTAVYEMPNLSQIFINNVKFPSKSKREREREKIEKLYNMMEVFRVISHRQTRWSIDWISIGLELSRRCSEGNRLGSVIANIYKLEHVIPNFMFNATKSYDSTLCRKQKAESRKLSDFSGWKQPISLCNLYLLDNRQNRTWTRRIYWFTFYATTVLPFMRHFFLRSKSRYTVLFTFAIWIYATEKVHFPRIFKRNNNR